MDCPVCEKGGGLGLKVIGGRDMVDWGMGVMSMGVSDLRSWRFLMVFSNLSSFCSTVVEASFFSMETTFSSMTWFPKQMFLMLSSMTEWFLCTISNSFVWVFEMEEMD